MTWKYYKVAGGNYFIDWDVCCRIIRSYHKSSLMFTYGNVVRESQTSLMDPLSWGLPDTWFINVDWGQVKAKSEEETLSDAFRMAAYATFQRNGIDQLVEELKGMQGTTRVNIDSFNSWKKDISDKSYHSIKSAIDSAENGLFYAKLTRDVSGSILIGAATVASGGTLAFGVGAGAVLKTTAKYQDTDDKHHPAAVAAVEAAQTIVTSVLPSKKYKAAKILISSVGDSSKALIEGKSVVKALGIGATTALTGVLGNSAKDFLKNKMSSTVASVAVKVTQDQSKKYLQSKIKAIGDKSLPQTPEVTVNGSDFYDSLTFEDTLLLKLAIIDEAKGIGGSGW